MKGKKTTGEDMQPAGGTKITTTIFSGDSSSISQFDKMYTYPFRS